MKKYIYTFAFGLLSLTGISQTIAVSSFAAGLSGPVEITHAGDERLFVVQQSGQIKIVNPDGSVNPTNFLNISSLISSSGERGLLGLAFHPQYASNGFFFVNYTRSGDGATVIARYSVSGDPNVADNTSGQTILTVSQPFSNHNGGTIKFGPDGYLYIGMGDGGSGGDPGNRAQNLADNLGKMLRIDVDNGDPYAIPSDNPFVGTTGNDEIFYYGLRNPWKFSFDRENGDLWIADVGQGEVEEINKLEAPLENSGLNLGWRCYEGSVVFEDAGCPAASTLTMPYAEYTHTATGGCSITGGYVYRGNLYPNFQGIYFFADYCKSEIGTVGATGNLGFTTNLSFAGNITTLGENSNGELFVAGGNTIYRIYDPTMGTDDFARAGFKIHPNPSDGEFFLDLPTSVYPAKLSLVDDAGRIVYNENLEASLSGPVQAPELSRGIYLVHLEDREGNTYSSKLSIN